MSSAPVEEVSEAIREILRQITIYIDDVAIHLGSHAPNTMTELRMTLAGRGLDILDEFQEFRAAFQRDGALRLKLSTLRTRYTDLEDKIKSAT